MKKNNFILIVKYLFLKKLLNYFSVFSKCPPLFDTHFSLMHIDAVTDINISDVMDEHSAIIRSFKLSSEDVC